MSNLLRIGKTGLFASKKSLETTGHNLANANTEGYSRQRIHQQASRPIDRHGHVMGTGTDVKGINRVHDPHLERQLNFALSNYHFHNERASQLEQIEKLFNEIDEEGLNKQLNKFYNSFRQLANNPENETIRSIVRNNARWLVNSFRRIRESIDQMASSIDRKLSDIVSQVNQQIRLVSQLNVKIISMEAASDEASDLRDQRDKAIRKISEFLKVHTYQDEKNRLIVHGVGVGTLVSGDLGQNLTISRKSREESSNNMPNSVEIFFENRPALRITKQFSDGGLASLVKLRNGYVRALQNGIDNIAYEFIQTTNAIHRRGFVNRNTLLSRDDLGPTTGIDFFRPPEKGENGRYRMAAKIALSDPVKDDLSNIVTALSSNAPGDNRIALAIAKLQHEKILNRGTTTLEENYLKIIGSLGVQARKANFDREQSQGILNQIMSIKDRVSGISIDEETANMLRFQHAYEASAKAMKTANEMLDSVLNIAP